MGYCPTRFSIHLTARTIACCAVLASCVALAQPRAVAPRGDLGSAEKATVELFQNAAPSVAYIYTETVQRRGLLRKQTETGAGSGFVWDKSGHIVTNHHVVAGVSQVFVQLDGAKPIAAKVVGSAPDYDLAVIKLAEVPANLKPIPVGVSRDLKVGQSVFAIGNPYGLSRTLTAGVVSALDRHLPTSEKREIAGVIQTDAAINPGNSGGPLLDSAGRLIGVNAAIISDSGASAGVGFSIPVDLVNRIVPELIRVGRAPRPGIGIGAADPSLAGRLGLHGVIITDVVRGLPAEAAGIVPYNRKNKSLGDVILAVNGNPTDTLASLVAEFDQVGIDGTAELTVWRNKQVRKVKVRVIDLSH